MRLPVGISGLQAGEDVKYSFKVKVRATTRLLTLLVALVACFAAPLATAEIRRAPQAIVCARPPRAERREIREPLGSASRLEPEALPAVAKCEFVHPKSVLNRPLFQRPPPSFFRS